MKYSKHHIDEAIHELDDLALEIGARLKTRAYAQLAHNDLVKMMEEYQAANKAYIEVLNDIRVKYDYWWKR